MIGILTFHNANNYGAMLQMYALQKKLDDLGVENEIIPYQCPKLTKQHQIRFRWWNPLGFIIKKRTQLLFDKFRKEQIRFGKGRTDIASLSGHDAIVVGSDQVWNMELTGGDFSFYLEQLPREIKRYSYAASMGQYRFCDETQKKRAMSCLKFFQGISVREESTKAYLDKELAIDNSEEIKVHLDPVFLLGKDEWNQMAECATRGRYILLYMIGRDERLIRTAQSLSKEKGMPVIWLSDSLRFYKGIKNKRSSTPNQFVGLFAGSEYVVTNSFHGTSFAVLYEKKFVTVLTKNGKKEERISNLLDALEIGAIAGADGITEVVETEDWNMVKQKLSLQVEQAENYIMNMVK